MIFLVGKTRVSLDTLVFAKVSTTAHRLQVDAGGRRSRLLRIAVWIVCERIDDGRACYIGSSLPTQRECIYALGRSGICVCN